MIFHEGNNLDRTKGNVRNKTILHKLSFYWQSKYWPTLLTGHPVHISQGDAIS